MSESPSSGVVEGAAGQSAQVLTPEAIAAVLADFQSWLARAAANEPVPAAPEVPMSAATESLDLHTLLGQFVALRHEVNLQTRASRTQQEHNGHILRHLEQALEALRHCQDKAPQTQQQAVEERLRPLLKTLIDVYDSLALAEREIQRIQDTVLPTLQQLFIPVEWPAAPTVESGTGLPARSLWSRLFQSASAGNAGATTSNAPPSPEQRFQELEEERQRRGQEISGRVRQMLTSLITGYSMSLQRVERALRQQGLESIPVKGELFDPELMEVVDVVNDSGRPSGEVLQEVRRGYVWNGRVFRFAQVRVARS